MHKLGLRGVEDLNRKALNPNIPPHGDKHPDVYVLGEAPGEKEDEQGKAFVGPSGKLLREHLGDELKLRFDNVCRTRPPNNRDPEWHELECFRPSVVASIEKAAPKVVLLVGRHAFTWAVPVKSAITVARGRRFPVWIGKHACWAVPVLHPAYILRLKNQLKDDPKSNRGEVPPKEIVKAWERDMEWVRGSAEWPDAEPFDLATLDDGVEKLIQVPSIVQALQELSTEPILSVDIETNRKRPYSDGAKILTVALSNGTRTVAFPLHHSRSHVNAEVLKALKHCFSVVRYLVAHNWPFDSEWLYHLLGVDTFKDTSFHDTMAQAFVMDERVGGMSLDYLCRQHLGLPLKSQSDVDKMNLESADLGKVLTYNARDAKATFYLHRKQFPLVKERGLLPAYKMQIRRGPAFVLTQRKGVLADTDAAKELDAELERDLESIKAKAAALPEIKKFEARHGPFRLSANHDIATALRSLGLIERGSSTDAEVLEGLDHPLARIVLDYRTAAKLRGTYVTKFLPGAKDGYVYPDGLIHCIFNTMFAATGRSSSEDPNNQNWPKRGKGRRVRRILCARPGYRLLSLDYKQLEFWIIACLSLDPKVLDAIRTGYDVHQFWAERIVRAYRQVLERRDIKGDMKAFRSATKNEWVFPGFFGSGVKSRAESVGIPMDVAEELNAEFWVEFRGVKGWQRTQTDFYEKHHYVQCATGRRRHAPLGYNQVINTPIQGTASDLVVNAMCTVSEMARRGDVPPWWQPCLNVHDDLTFEVPEKKVEREAEAIAKVMTDVSPYPWAVVPLTVEAESGPHWAAMEKVGTYKGKDPGMRKGQ